jgi:DinB superfamily
MTPPTPSIARAAGPRIDRPSTGEFAPVFTDEIALVPDAPDFAEMLAEQHLATHTLAAAFGETNAALRYAPDKWTVREVIGHLADCERILSYRMLRALRADPVVLPGFDQNAYVPAGHFERQAMADVLDGFSAVRAATVALIRSAPAESFAFRLNVGSGSITARALAYLIAGHERHHQVLLRERYLPLVPARS